MKCITLTQPWASLIAIGAKRVETRSWATPHKGMLAIHAGKGLGPVGGKEGLHSLCRRVPFCTALQPLIGTDVNLLPLGQIIAVVELVACRHTEELEPILSEQERAFGDYSFGRWGWLLRNVRPLRTPISTRGALSLWEYDTAAIMAMVEQ
jgi:hypothetical protein